jgi:hypothetical protein
MTERKLFEQSFHAYLEKRIKEALAKVAALSEKDLADPSLSEKLDAIANDGWIVVATLRAAERKGKRRTEKRVDLGDEDEDGLMIPVEREIKVIDVLIPVDGYPISLQLSPSSSIGVSEKARMVPGGLQVTFPDDDNLDRNVDDFISRVSQNLDRLRVEAEANRPIIRQRVGEAAKRRQDELAAQKDRDSKRSFPIE